MHHAPERREPRIAFEAPVRLLPAAEESALFGHSANVSNGGLQVYAGSALSVGTELACDIPLPDDCLRVQGRVVWSRQEEAPANAETSGAALGIQFSELSIKEILSLRQLVREAPEDGYVSVWFEGVERPIRSRASVCRDGIELRSGLPFLRSDSTIDISFAGEEGERAYKGRLSHVALDLEGAVPSLKMIVDVPAWRNDETEPADRNAPGPQERLSPMATASDPTDELDGPGFAVDERTPLEVPRSAHLPEAGAGVVSEITPKDPSAEEAPSSRDFVSGTLFLPDRAAPATGSAPVVAADHPVGALEEIEVDLSFDEASPQTALAAPEPPAAATSIEDYCTSAAVISEARRRAPSLLFPADEEGPANAEAEEVNQQRALAFAAEGVSAGWEIMDGAASPPTTDASGEVGSLYDRSRSFESFEISPDLHTFGPMTSLRDRNDEAAMASSSERSGQPAGEGARSALGEAGELLPALPLLHDADEEMVLGPRPSERRRRLWLWLAAGLMAVIAIATLVRSGLLSSPAPAKISVAPTEPDVSSRLSASFRDTQRTPQRGERLLGDQQIDDLVALALDQKRGAPGAARALVQPTEQPSIRPAPTDGEVPPLLNAGATKAVPAPARTEQEAPRGARTAVDHARSPQKPAPAQGKSAERGAASAEVDGARMANAAGRTEAPERGAPRPTEGSMPGLAVRRSERGTTLTLDLRGSLAESRHYVLADPDGVAIMIPHARTRLPFGHYAVHQGQFRGVWVWDHEDGPQVRVFFEEGTPLHRVAITPSAIQITVPRESPGI